MTLLRSFRSSPGFTVIAVLTLALGIGAATTIFSITDALLFHVFPYRNSDRLVLFRVHELRPGGYDGAASPPADAFRNFRASAQSFEGIAGFWHANLLYTTSEGAQQVQGAWVTDNTFAFLGVPASLGRGLLPGDGWVCVVSDRFWREQLHADSRVLGTVLPLNGVPRAVVGVMPPRFQFLGASVWIPLGNGAGEPGYREMMARLKPGVSVASATAEFDAFEHRIFPGERFTVSLRPLVEDAVGNLRPVLFTLFAAVTMLLLIACSNVANLLLARATMQEREVAIRAALGATRGRLMRESMAESAALAAAAGGLGCGLAWFGLRAVAALIPQRLIPGEAAIGIHLPALWFTIAAIAATTLFCGLAPALQVSRANLAAPMVRGSRSRLRGLLVIAEVALSIVLLIGAGLMIRTFLALTRVDLGFSPAHLLQADVNFPRGRYRSVEAEQGFAQELTARLRQMPGVRAAGINFEVPPAESGPVLELEGVPGTAMLGAAGEDSFAVMGRAIRSGRPFSREEIGSARQLLIVNQSFARAFFGGTDPVGRKVRFRFEHMIGAPSDPSFDIVGVVSDVRNQGVRKAVMPEAYVPYTLPMVGMGKLGILVRTEGPPLAMVEPIRRAVWSLDPGVMLAHAVTVEQAVAESSYAEPRFGLVSIGGFAALGLALVVAGVFSVMAYVVSTQTRDVGVRMALGAQRDDVVAMVLRRGLAWVGIGIAVGVPLSLLLTRLLASQLWGVSATDPWTFAAVIALSLVAGTAACVAPALRAAAVDPLVALRHE